MKLDLQYLRSYQNLSVINFRPCGIDCLCCRLQCFKACGRVTSARGLGAYIANSIWLLCCHVASKNCSNKVVIQSFSGQTNSTTKIGERYIICKTTFNQLTHFTQSFALKVILLIFVFGGRTDPLKRSYGHNTY